MLEKISLVKRGLSAVSVFVIVKMSESLCRSILIMECDAKGRIFNAICAKIDGSATDMVSLKLEAILDEYVYVGN